MGAERTKLMITVQYVFKNYILSWVLLGLLVGGCHLPWQPQGVEGASNPSPEARMRYDKAIEAYCAGNYESAAEQFRRLREDTFNSSLARMALFGQACARLMAARTPKAYGDALKLWDSWAAGAPTDLAYENPVLFAPLINEKMLFSNLESTDNEPAPANNDQAATQWVLVKTKQELDKVKKELGLSEKAAQQKQQKIEILEKEIAKLKQQISALETIDHKIQQKKNAIPATD
jgi:hypothetical protein